MRFAHSAKCLKSNALRALRLAALCALLCSAAMAAERGTILLASALYISPDTGAAKLATVERGREAALLERTPGWVHVVATLTEARFDPDVDLEAAPGRSLTGWMPDKGYIGESTANGDQILFGEAADSEDQASRSHGRKGAAGDARRLYRRVFDLFPNSPLAGEALYRAADIQWQLDREDENSRPSHRALPEERPQIDEQAMRLVHKKFPGSRWDELAAYAMLENKLCGEWAGSSKCPEREAEVYEKYAADHPNSPRCADAWYKAAWSWAAAMTMYVGEGQSKKIPEAQKRALADAQKLISKNSGAEWNAKAQRLLYMVQNNIPVYGTSAE